MRPAEMPRAADGLVYAPDGAVYDPDGVLVPWQRRPRPERPAPTITLRAIADELSDCGLRPVVDTIGGLVLSDCPDCHGEDTDPLSLWRPLQVIPTPGQVAYVCAGCGAEVVRRV